MNVERGRGGSSMSDFLGRVEVPSHEIVKILPQYYKNIQWKGEPCKSSGYQDFKLNKNR